MDSVLVLIAAPGSGAIDGGAARRVRQLTGAEPLWLATAEAVEFPLPRAWRQSEPSAPGQELPAPTPERRALADALEGVPVDIAIVPAANRRKRLLIADMDSTMIAEECIDELGALTAHGDRIRDITTRAMRGDLDFTASLRERVALMRGLPRSAIADLLAGRITLMPGGGALVATMKAKGAYTALISGGFLPFTEHVAQALGFDEHRANELVFDDGRFTGLVKEPILGKDAKLEALIELCASRGLSTDDAITVGDGANDIPMLQAAGLGVALHAKLAVKKASRIAIDHGDLTALLYLQGYRKDEFIEG